MSKHIFSILAASMLSAFFCLLVNANQVQAATVNSASCSQADVQAAVESAGEGDTVFIPAGICTWTAGVSLGRQLNWTPPVQIESKALTIAGAGIDSTIIVNEIPQNPSGINDGVFMITTAANKSFRLTNLTIRGGATGTGNSWHGTVRIGGYDDGFRIDHVKFDRLNNHALETSGSALGVLDHCEFVNLNTTTWMQLNLSTWNDKSYGDGSWASPLSLGTSQAVYIEDNTFTQTSGSYAMVDAYTGARFVFRHNNVLNGHTGNHGTESTGRGRGVFSYEIYDNVFNRTDQTHYWTVFHSRGGTGVMFNNVATGPFDNLAVVKTYRMFHSFSPWGACDGTNPYDLNDVTIRESGIHTGTSSTRVLASAGKNWTVNQWKGYVVHNVNKDNGSEIAANTADTINLTADSYTNPLTWDAGDGFEIRKAPVCLDSVGRGPGTLFSGNPPLPAAWPSQPAEPFYEWNNTINGADADIVGGTSDLVEGTSFINDIPRPGYTPYAYPHPLITGEADASAPAVPANLAVS